MFNIIPLMIYLVKTQFRRGEIYYMIHWIIRTKGGGGCYLLEKYYNYKDTLIKIYTFSFRVEDNHEIERFVTFLVWNIYCVKIKAMVF